MSKSDTLALPGLTKRVLPADPGATPCSRLARAHRRELHGRRGKTLYFLDAINAPYPPVMHEVALSTGGPHEIDVDYRRQLKSWSTEFSPAGA
jgi:hypothetical protein